MAELPAVGSVDRLLADYSVKHSFVTRESGMAWVAASI